MFGNGLVSLRHKPALAEEFDGDFLSLFFEFIVLQTAVLAVKGQSQCDLLRQIVHDILKLQRQLIELLVNRGAGNIDDGIAIDDRTLHKQFDGLREENGVALHQFHIYLENTAAGSHIRGHGNDSLTVLNRAGSVLLCKVVSDYRVISDGDRGQIDIRAVLRQRKHEADAVGITFVYLNGF